MPTQGNYEGSLSESETKGGEPSVTSEPGPLDPVSPNLSGTVRPSPDEMTRDEALAIAWTGIEVLARMGLVKLLVSPESERVAAIFLETQLNVFGGLVPTGKGKTE